MNSAPPNDMNAMDDPEGGCIVQADDPQMLAAAAFDGAGSGAGNNTWYWTSMLKLMEQGSAAPASSMITTSSTAHNINNINYSTTAGAPFTPGQQQAATAADRTPPALSASSPSSSSVHDQPMDMVTPNSALNACDPDSSVWAQEFLSGPIGENKTSTMGCSDDGLHELLYPRTVLELLFSDQLKLEQMPSWPDILQAHSAAGGSAKSFGFPLISEIKVEAGTPTALEDNNVSMENHMKFSQYLHNFSYLAGVDDRLSSSTTSSTLSDNATDQWAAPQAGSSGAAENMQAYPGVMPAQYSSQVSNIQHVKQEYNHVASPPLNTSSNDHGCQYPGQYNNLHHHPQNLRIMANNINMSTAAGNGFQESPINDGYEQKPNLLSKLWSPVVLNNANDPLAHINHKHHIYESITAANFSQNLRQLAAGLSTATNYNLHLQPLSSNMNIGPSSLQSYIHQPSQVQFCKKSRPFQDGGGAGPSVAGQDHAQLVESARTNGREEESDILMLQQSAAGDEEAKAKVMMSGAQGTMHVNLQQQPGAAEYSNFKRSRIEQQAAAAPPPTSSGSSSTTNQNHSTSSKSQPVRKEKLSERIATLQQLVSPFGKTDTASVLLEAIGYIKFLQEQVQALSSPYFKNPSIQNVEKDHNAEEIKPDLRSRGLCLVPLSCTLQVANDNGADYWYAGSFR